MPANIMYVVAVCWHGGPLSCPVTIHSPHRVGGCVYSWGGADHVLVHMCAYISWSLRTVCILSDKDTDSAVRTAQRLILCRSTVFDLRLGPRLASRLSGIGVVLVAVWLVSSGLYRPVVH